MARSLFTLALCLSSLAASGATLERLTLEEMTTRSTAIIRGQAVSTSAVQVGSTIYTRTVFQVLENYKGPQGAQVEVMEPGGTIGPISQNYSGVPRFRPGVELVLFLWTGPSGRTQVIGLSQGVFELARSSASGEVEVVRRPSGEVMLSSRTRQQVPDEELRVPLRKLVSIIRSSAMRQRQD
ncbi:MAG: hypothetical protein HY236_18220 [Acidobacteria bacterium]|nr:hypothetical protein [Acidobacteriota bacterium]